MSAAPTRYRILTYDGDVKGEAFGWRVRAHGMRLWSLRRAIRRCRDEGYDDDCSILVEREEDQPRRRKR